MNIKTEHTFESALIQSPIDQGGYTEGNATDYSPELGLFKHEIIHKSLIPSAAALYPMFFRKRP